MILIMQYSKLKMEKENTSIFLVNGIDLKSRENFPLRSNFAIPSSFMNFEWSFPPDFGLIVLISLTIGVGMAFLFSLSLLAIAVSIFSRVSSFVFRPMQELKPIRALYWIQIIGISIDSSLEHLKSLRMDSLSNDKRVT